MKADDSSRLTEIIIPPKPRMNLIYSVGANGRNDDGANAERQNQDDISFEAPPP